MVSDWIGALFFVVLMASVFLFLRKLSKPAQSTEQEFEKRAEEGGSLLSAGVSALQGMLQPEERRATEAVREFKEERSSNAAKAGEVPDKNVGSIRSGGSDQNSKHLETGEK